MDGGTVWDVNVDSAINQCLEIVDSEEDIILDIAICEWAPHKHGYDISQNAVTNFQNARSERDFYTTTNSL